MEYFFAALTSVIFLIIVIVAVIIGWYLVWKLFLSRFRFVHELFESTNHTGANNKNTESTKRPRRNPVKKE